jgi:hypothetical protein
MIMIRHQNAGKIYNLLTANKYFENMAEVKYFGTVANKNCIYKETERITFGECFLPFHSEFCLPVLSLKT